MKKLFSFLLASLLLPFALGALDLQPNQKIMGHYTTDELATTGWGKGFLTGVHPIATDITPDELALFQGSKIVAFRVGLAESAPITRVFVMPLGTNGKPTGEVIEWECNASSQGWNLIELEIPYLINMPDGCGLRIGFDYEQVSSTARPISAVEVGTIYPTYLYRSGNWVNYGVNTQGNLSLQCICENDNFPQYIVRATGLNCKAQVKTGDDLPFSFKAYNLGALDIAPGELTFYVAIDGVIVKTISNPATLTSSPITIQDVVNTAGLTAQNHTLTVTTATLYGEPMVYPIVLTAQFKNFDYGYTRQMHLAEQFTSTSCTYCPMGTANIQNLCDMRGDVAWVAIHNIQNNGYPDPFRTAQADSLMNFEGLTGWPEGSFDRTAGLESTNAVLGGIAGISASEMNTFLNNIEDNNPALATVNINSTFDEATRKVVITIDGELTPNFDQVMGTNNRLTVYLTEDGLVAPQYNSGTWVNNYVHNNVLRQALVSVKGVTLNKTGDSYKNEFTYTIPADWNAENMNIVAFVSRPLRSNALTDIYVINTNKRKLGEFDEPSVQGDVDENGVVSIADVTALIDYLLKGEASGISAESADCDKNGEVTIADVTALIDYLLKGQW